ncbi:hypothetical protein [Fibrella forsythiae]|uniref:Uncharacterized protein n=1 Tax=Fibrella forsythiae TaxID=2817061 RepID=A0ABS3JNJ9_9BACT|nr:hypothetical protein [Fibrella forsythiae]MBO0951058.1 hypothetical protein [Fibrella forsythiae]
MEKLEDPLLTWVMGETGSPVEPSKRRYTELKTPFFGPVSAGHRQRTGLINAGDYPVIAVTAFRVSRDNNQP